MKHLILLLLFLQVFLPGFAQQDTLNVNKEFPLLAKDEIAQKQWVDSIYDAFSLDEKIGQLFMVDLFPEESQQNIDYVKTLVQDYHVGGVIFFKGRPTQQAKLTNEYQKMAKTPLLMGIDGEWGLSMRLDSTFAFPWNMTLGAIEDNELIRRVGAKIGEQAKRIGLQFDFAPSVDININPKNPIIGFRSFGEDPKRVAEKGMAFVEGMQEAGVLTTAKHFPGHGDTEVDSHYELPVIDKSRKQLDSVELYPYYKMIPQGLPGVMVSHLNVPALDNRSGRPASLSRPIITDLLKKEMQFKGLVVTDAMNMKGLADSDEDGQTSLEAFLAGNDILLYPVNVPSGIRKIKKAYEEEKVTEERLAHSVKKILMAKYQTGLHNLKPIETDRLIEDLNTPDNDMLYEELMENALTLIKNNRAILPLQELGNEKTAYVALGDDQGNSFYQMLNNYEQVDKVAAENLSTLMEKLKNYDRVIVGFHKSNASPWESYKFKENELVWLHEIAREHSVILSVFANPYSLLDVRSTTNLDAILMGYQNSIASQEKAAQIIYGGIGAKGRLPVSLGSQFPQGTRFTTGKLNRLSYGSPESAGMNSDTLKKIDALAQNAIAKKMTPGMQVLVARKGKVVYKKNFGYQTYDKSRPITDDAIYDVASLTKILTTLPLLMELEEKGELGLDDSLGDIMPFLKGSNKASLSFKKTLSHYARFKPWIPYFRATLNKDKKPDARYYIKEERDGFEIEVAENMFMRTDYRDSIYAEIMESDLISKSEYKYSDLPFYLFQKYLEEHYGESLDKIADQHFYKRLGANYTGFNPLTRFDKFDIVPSEEDTYWRNQIVRGYVNDQGAAMLGGIGGHAGLFSNANDIAKIMQMYLNGGGYGGIRYLKTETIEKFNTCYYCAQDVRRGVGFDKPQLKEPGPASKLASINSFGHTGFTGTIAWVDPDEDLIYIVLANRTFPDPGNRNFIKESIRTKIQDIIYKAIDRPLNEEKFAADVH